MKYLLKRPSQGDFTCVSHLKPQLPSQNALFSLFPPHPSPHGTGFHRTAELEETLNENLNSFQM